MTILDVEYEYGISQNQPQNSGLEIQWGVNGEAEQQQECQGQLFVVSFRLSAFFHEAHEYFTYPQPHPLFFWLIFRLTEFAFHM